MNTVVHISNDPVTLQTKISVNRDDENVINKLKIFIYNLSDNSSYFNRNFFIPWFEIRRNFADFIIMLKKEAVSISYDNFTEDLIKEIISDKKSIKNKQSILDVNESNLFEILKSSGFNRELKPEQVRDTLKLLSLKNGANFSVPGAGKTTTILAVFTVLKNYGLVSKAFIVCPINAFISWEDEVIEIFGEKVITVHRLDKNQLQGLHRLENLDRDLILVNYEKLRNDIKELVPFFIKNKIHFILDESHRIKSGKNNISFTQIIKLADLARRRDILSGTPMPQSYYDLEPQLDFLWPGENIIPYNINLNNDPLAIINQSIEGLFVRTTKDELGLEDPIVSYKKIEMGPIQKELYNLFKSEASRRIAKLDKLTLNNFRKIGKSVIKLLQAASNPLLLTSKDEYDEELNSIPKDKQFWELLEDFQKYEKPSKIEFLKNSIKEILDLSSNKKIVIWSYFVRNILILEKIFTRYNPVIIYGGIPSGSDEEERNREGRIRKFHEDNTCRMMIANPQACGEGISLHKVCHHAIYLDRNFNAAYFLQSIDRIHRLGLEENVETNVDILIAPNTIDEIIINRLNEKITAMAKVLDDSTLNSLAYDPEDISIEDEIGIDMKDFLAIKDHVFNEKN